jgi:predicted peptidase
MRTTSLFATILCSLLASFTTAQDSIHPDILYGDQPELIDLSTNIDEQRYPCAVIINKAARKAGPAILFLHGYGECGTDNKLQRTVGLPKHALENPERWPFVFIVPQKPIHNSEWEDHEHALIHFLDTAAEQGLYDPDRLAITGLSQGGHGTMTIAQKYPDRFRAAAPVCGYLRPVFTEQRERIEHPEASKTLPEFIAAAKKLESIPMWFWHGDSDSIVPVSESRAMHSALKAINASTRYSELPNVDHNAWDAAYTDRDLAEWFEQHLKD